MKKTIIFTAVLCSILCFGQSKAFADPFDFFTAWLNSVNKQGAQTLLDRLARDVGQAIAGGAYGTNSSAGGALGLGGINLSIKMSYQQVPTDNIIVRYTGSDALYYPIVQADIDLTDDLAAIARASYMYSSTLLGGGLRYRIYDASDDEIYVPTVSVQSVFNYLMMDDGFNKFDAWNLKTSPVAFFDRVPYVTPYVFISYDITSLTAHSSQYSGMNSTLNGIGYGMGLSLKVNSINLSGSISMYEGQPNYNFGIFVGI